MSNSINPVVAWVIILPIIISFTVHFYCWFYNLKFLPFLESCNYDFRLLVAGSDIFVVALFMFFGIVGFTNLFIRCFKSL